MSELVSIIMPTFNREKKIIKAIDSVRSQTYKNWELIIVDNFSTDETKKNIENLNDHRIKFFQIKNNGIIARSRNYGIDKSSGEIISFLDSDDWWKFDKLQQAVNFIKKGYDFTYHRLIKYNENKNFIIFNKTHSYNLTEPIFKNLMKGGNCIPNSSVSILKKYIINVGKFSESEDLVGSEDFDGWLKIAKLTDKFIEIPKALGYCHIGNDNYSNDSILLRNLQTLENIHLADSNEISSSFSYQRARIFQREKSYRKAIEFYKAAIVNKPHSLILARSLVSLFILKILLFLRLIK